MSDARRDCRPFALAPAACLEVPNAVRLRKPRRFSGSSFSVGRSSNGSPRAGSASPRERVVDAIAKRAGPSSSRPSRAPSGVLVRTSRGPHDHPRSFSRALPSLLARTLRGSREHPPRFSRGPPEVLTTTLGASHGRFQAFSREPLRGSREHPPRFSARTFQGPHDHLRISSRAPPKVLVRTRQVLVSTSQGSHEHLPSPHEHLPSPHEHFPRFSRAPRKSSRAPRKSSRAPRKSS